MYCQSAGTGLISTDRWQGVERVNIPVTRPGALGTIEFDWRATRHAARQGDLCLTLGYNTAIFCAWLRLGRVLNIINMDGIEWHRAKWGAPAKAWFWLNEWAGCWLGDHLVADHPAIKTHLATRVRSKKITTIAYGADRVDESGVDGSLLARFGLESRQFLTVVARPEPENSLLEIVRGFSCRARRVKLVVLGSYDKTNAYHCAVMAAASAEVVFVGAIYVRGVVQALRVHSLAYVHGHQVGGTNPSLVEALGAGNAVIAHDNRFNRWVAGDGARYFDGAAQFSAVLDELLARPEELVRMAGASCTRFESGLTWPQVLAQYECLLSSYLPR